MKTLAKLALVFLVCLLGCEQDTLFQTLTVVNGQGGGEYEVGTKLTITANPPEAEMGFSHWIGDTVYLNKPRAVQAILTMPLSDVYVEAIYKALPKYKLDVIGGTGSGSYLEGTEVAVSAEIPGEDYQFVDWAGDTVYMTKHDTIDSYVIMPAEDIQIEATFEEIIQLISFSQQVFPLIKRNCNSSSCHSAKSRDYPLSTYDEVYSSRDGIKSFVLDRSMPIGRTLKQEEIDLIVGWIDQGAKNN
ncbi:MAG: hypothetical protein AAFO07_02765 [Bacteroidota bacterium]